MTIKSTLKNYRTELLFLAILIIVSGLSLIFYHHIFSFDALKETLIRLKNTSKAHFFFSLIAFLSSYIIFSILPIPGETALNILAGFMYGTRLGIILGITGSLLGALITFLTVRKFLGSHVISYYNREYQHIARNLEKNGIWYLLSMRFAPTIPPFITNIIAGILPISAQSFALTTAIGLIPKTALMVHAGEKLTSLTSMQGIFSKQWVLILFAFSALSLLPVIWRFLVKVAPFTNK